MSADFRPNERQWLSRCSPKSSQMRPGNQLPHSLIWLKVAVGGSTEDNVARVWAIGGQLLANLQHGGAVLRVSFNQSGTQLLTACFGDHFARIWDVLGQNVV